MPDAIKAPDFGFAILLRAVERPVPVDAFVGVKRTWSNDKRQWEWNEVYKISMINLDTTGSGDDNLTSALGVNQTFTLEVIPTKGAVLHIERTTPIYMDLINFLN